MKYPTLDEVNEAGQTQLCRWMRFLPSPGMNAIRAGSGTLTAEWRRQAEEIGEKERDILMRIGERHGEGGGFTPAISKAIGWDPPS